MSKSVKKKLPSPHYHQFDLPDSLTLEGDLAIDTETKGLNLVRDRLCCIQIADSKGEIHIVHFPKPHYQANNLQRLFAQPSLKIFHYARFDLAILRRDLGIYPTPVFCTKIASRLARTYTHHHSLSKLCQEFLGISLDKQQQCTNWGAPKLSEEQLHYAANDVRYLHELRDHLEEELQLANRHAIAKACFSFLPVRVELDLRGWNDEDIFSHSLS